jgi:hypothetical protein
MKNFLLIILTGLCAINANGQVSFSPVNSKLKTKKSNDLTELSCSSPTMSLKFQLKRQATVLQQNNFAIVDSQTIQLNILKFSDSKRSKIGQSMAAQKQLLNEYSKYELDYFENELGIDVINLESQWVVTKAKGWFIWYFRVGNLPTLLEKQTAIQLFASTVIGDKILTVNAPILFGGDFNKAGFIVNEMMETMLITKQ